MRRLVAESRRGTQAERNRGCAGLAAPLHGERVPWREATRRRAGAAARAASRRWRWRLRRGRALARRPTPAAAAQASSRRRARPQPRRPPPTRPSFEAAEPGRGRAGRARRTTSPARLEGHPLAHLPRDQRRPADRRGRQRHLLHPAGHLPGAGRLRLALRPVRRRAARCSEQLRQLSAIFPPDAVRPDRRADAAAGHRAGRPACRSPSCSACCCRIWSANAGMKALFDGLNIAYDETEKRNFVLRTALTYGFTLGAAGLPDRGQRHPGGRAAGAGGAAAARGLADPAALAAGAAPWRAGAFAILYRYGPSRAPARWRWVIGGSAGRRLRSGWSARWASPGTSTTSPTSTSPTARWGR